MQSGTIEVVKNSEGTSVKNKIWGSFSLYFGHLSLSCNSLLTCVFICSSNLFHLYFLLLRELISVMTKNTCWNTKGH